MRVIRSLALLLSGISLVVSCAPSASTKTKEAVNSATVTGTVGGATLTPTSAVADLVPFFPANKPALVALRLIFADKANTCDLTHTASTTLLDVRLVTGASGVQVGTFPIVDATTASPTENQAEADFNELDGTCQATVAQTATTGSLTIKGGQFSGSPLHVTGTIDVTFAGGHLAGDFNAAYCPPAGGAVDASGGPDAGALACTP